MAGKFFSKQALKSSCVGRGSALSDAPRAQTIKTAKSGEQILRAKFAVKFVAVLASRPVFCEISRGFKEASNFTERAHEFELKFTALFTAQAAQI